MWDPEALAAEVRRVAAKGCRAITMPELPHIQGLPSYHNVEYWDPFFGRVSEEQVVMCLHIGQGFAAINSAPEAPIDNLIILATQVSALAAQDLLWGPAFRDYPDLKVAWSEAGIGWIPFYLNRCDRHYTNQRWLGHDFGDKLPSDIFRDHSLACYVTDPDCHQGARGHRDRHHRLGVRLPTFRLASSRRLPSSCTTSLVAGGCSDEEIDKITWQNTCRFFGWDPFRHIGRTDATVGGLRRQSPDVDTTIRTKHEWRALYETAASS